MAIGVKLAYVAAAIAVPMTASGQTLPVSSLPAIPDLVTPTNGINLGNTSFYDGFSTLKPGITVLQYVSYDHADSIVDQNGKDSPAFDRPKISTSISLTQLSVATPVSIDGHRVGFDVLLPIINFSSSFGPRGLNLNNNGLGIGDIAFGPSLQFKPIMRAGRPLASVRVALNILAPTGKFSRQRDINQSSGYWSMVPYLAWTVLPAKGWDISGRFQYLHNFKTNKIPNPPEIPGFSFKDGKAGNMIFSNFAISKSVSDRFSIGLNGYAMQQISNNRINGLGIANRKRSALFLGPGLRLDRFPSFALNANVYFPVEARNYITGPKLNIQFIVPIK